jgi:hypothetical protein
MPEWKEDRDGWFFRRLKTGDKDRAQRLFKGATLSGRGFLTQRSIYLRSRRSAAAFDRMK